jgi:thiol-disulfide isomerase/thioredoxin
MKYYVNLCLLLVALIFSIATCTKKEERSSVKITLNTVNKSKDSIRLISHLYLNEETVLAGSKPDSIGTCVLELSLYKPTMAYIQIDPGEQVEVYLEPGYDLIFSVNENSKDKPINYAGNGAVVNNYLSGVSSIINKIKFANGKYIAELETQDFLKRFDSLCTVIDSFQGHYFDSVGVSKDQIILLEKIRKIKLLSIRQEYTFLLQNNALVEQMQARTNGKEIPKFDVPLEWKNVTDEVPFDSALLTIGLSDYQYLLFMYLNNKIHIPDYDVKTWENIKYHYPLKANGKIKSGNYPHAIKEYLIATDIQYWLSMQGITPAIDSMLTSFKKDFVSSTYLPSLQKDYNGWLAVSPGNLAPEFSGTMPDGTNFSLSDLKGKVVYVDVWATWCAPCKEEIPYAKKLQKKFEGNDQIVFLNISVDRNIEAWKKFLSKDTSWKGIHINQQGEQDDHFWKTYKISGVPTYILIDQAGKIVDAKAARPSDPKTQDQILNILNKKI